MDSLDSKNYLDTLIGFLKKNFQRDWINSKVSEFQSEEERRGWLIEKFLVSLDFFCENIDYSILSGEYIPVDDKLLNDKLNEIINLLKAIIDFTLIPIGSSSEEETSKQYDNYYNQISNYFVTPLISVINRYELLVNFKTRHLKAQNLDSVLFEKHTQDEIIDIKDNFITVDIEKKIRATYFNLELAKFDLSLMVDEKILSRCIWIVKEIESFSLPQKYYRLIRQKANYISYKILYRCEQDEKSYLFSLNSNVEEIDKEGLDVGVFDSFKKITDNHYNEQRSKSSDYSKKRIEEFYAKLDSGKVPELKDYHAVIKYYKDNKTNLERLNNLVIEYQSFCEQEQKNPSITLFNKRAYTISLHYILNNQLSLGIAKKKINLTNWKEEYDKFLIKNEENRIYNYFPYYKLSNFLSAEIENEFGADEPNIEILASLIESLQNVLGDLEKTFNWCVKNYFLAFQLTFEECLIYDPELKINVFLSSSFVLPLNYPKLLSEIKIIESNVLKFNTMLSIQKSISRQTLQIDEVKKQNQKSERRSIEVLSVFAAIVMFVSGNIQIFTKVETIERSLQFMLLFAYVLGLFVFLIWFISRPEGIKGLKIISVHGFLVFVFVLSTIVALAIVCGTYPFDKVSKTEDVLNLNKKIDSTKVRFDSLINARKRKMLL